MNLGSKSWSARITSEANLRFESRTPKKSVSWSVISKALAAILCALLLRSQSHIGTKCSSVVQSVGVPSRAQISGLASHGLHTKLKPCCAQRLPALSAFGVFGSTAVEDSTECATPPALKIGGAKESSLLPATAALATSRAAPVSQIQSSVSAIADSSSGANKIFRRSQNF